MLRPEKGGPAYLGDNCALTWTYPEVKDVKINQEEGDLDEVLDEVVKMFNGLGNWGSPLTMCNVLPQANTAAILASMMAQVFAAEPDRRRVFLERRARRTRDGRDLCQPDWLGRAASWRRLNLGRQRLLDLWRQIRPYPCSAKLACEGHSDGRQDHLFTASPFLQENCSDWTGLGMDNVIRVRTDIATNQMDVVDLEEVLKELAASKTPVAVVVCTMGTTNSSCLRPDRQGKGELLDRYPNPKGYGKTILYADAVVGWSWIYFKDYDFAKNPLGFSERILPILRQNGQAMMSEIEHADCVGIDFHKVGFAPYVSSFFVYKNAAEFEGRPSPRRRMLTCRSGRPTIRCTTRWKFRGPRAERSKPGRR